MESLKPFKLGTLLLKVFYSFEVSQRPDTSRAGHVWYDMVFQNLKTQDS